MADCIPGVGMVLGPLYSQVNEIKQDGKMTLINTSKNIALSIIGAKNSKAGLVASSVDTGYSLVEDKKYTYNQDGITIKEGDTYILIETQTNQGLDVSNVRVYVRNNEIISYQQFGPYGGYGHYGGYEKMIKHKWKKEGYK